MFDIFVLFGCCLCCLLPVFVNTQPPCLHRLNSSHSAHTSFIGAWYPNLNVCIVRCTVSTKFAAENPLCLSSQTDLASNQHQCMWPRTHVVKPSWGALYDPKLACKRSGLCGGQNLWVHAGCCEPPVRGLFALLGDLSCATHTQSAPPCTTRARSFPNQWLLWCMV